MVPDPESGGSAPDGRIEHGDDALLFSYHVRRRRGRMNVLLCVPDGGTGFGPPEEAFAVLGHEIRLSILRALFERYEPTASPDGVMPVEVEPLSYSALLDRVDVDDHGKLNYHLGKLLGRFVYRTDKGYELTDAGMKLVQAIIAGSIIETPTLPPADIGVDCPLCGATVLIDYDNGAVRARCSNCRGCKPRPGQPPGTLFRIDFPPNGLRRRTLKEVVAAAHLFARRGFVTALEGTCPFCAGETRVSVDACLDHAPGDDGLCATCGRHTLTTFVAACESCKQLYAGEVGIALFYHPVVVSFYHEHGFDYRYEPGPPWTRTLQYGETVVSRDPLRVRVTIPAGDDELLVTVDEEATVVASETRRRDA